MNDQQQLDEMAHCALKYETGRGVLVGVTGGVVVWCSRSGSEGWFGSAREGICEGTGGDFGRVVAETPLPNKIIVEFRNHN